MAELWDAYYKDGTKSDKKLTRGEAIPEGLYHLVSDILVKHKDGDYLLMQRDLSKPNFGGFWEATAGGSALVGEDALTCAKRELLEECGISQAESWEEIGKYTSHNTHYHSFLCTTPCNKASVALQDGETIAFRWISEKEFINFINSGDMIPTQKNRLLAYFDKMNYLK